jgi:uncharacterized protein with PIN domain
MASSDDFALTNCGGTVYCPESSARNGVCGLGAAEFSRSCDDVLAEVSSSCRSNNSVLLRLFCRLGRISSIIRAVTDGFRPRCNDRHLRGSDWRDDLLVISAAKVARIRCLAMQVAANAQYKAMQQLQKRSFSVHFHFSADLGFFLGKPNDKATLTRTLREKTSVKDAIEASGVPHPEIDLIRCDRVIVPFEHQLTGDAVVQAYGVDDSPASAGDALQARRVTKFVADRHLGKLARDLRLLGFDVFYLSTAHDAELVALSVMQGRALLTRDRRLLMHKVVHHGYCPRSHDPGEQGIETVRRFHLKELIAPFTRCIHCNGILAKADKRDVLDELEPLTRIYYDQFRRCLSCRKVYWSGSHFGKLQARVSNIRTRLLR